MQLPYKASFGGAKFDRGWDQLMYGSLMLPSAYKLLNLVLSNGTSLRREGGANKNMPRETIYSHRRYD